MTGLARLGSALGIVACLAGPASAEVGIVELPAKIAAIHSLPDVAARCDAALKDSEHSSGATLFYGAGLCGASGRDEDAAVLLLEGQVRSVTDLVLLKPDDPAATQTAAQLYGLLYYRFGGPGAVTIYEDKAAAARVMARFDAWTAAIDPDYRPGWPPAARPEPAAYAKMVREEKSRRLEQLAGLVVLYADPAYRAASDELQALMARNPNGFVEGTADYERSQAVTATMADAAKRLKIDR